jgi:hypothetical protein
MELLQAILLLVAGKKRVDGVTPRWKELELKKKRV